MEEQGAVRRTYDGSRRRAEADARRRTIVERATELFVASGFGATSIDQIARAADVSSPTVYAAFGSKAALLATAIDFALVGDGARFTVAARFAQVLDAAGDDPVARSVAAASYLRTINQAVAPLIRVLELAASADVALGELRATLIAALRADCRLVIEKYFADSLRAGISVDAAADTMAVITSPTTYSMFTVDGEWTPDQYQAWLADSFPRLILDV